MATRFLTALILGLALVPAATAQTVRFDTNVGNIDLVLNPMGLPELRGHVDNMLAYVENAIYDKSVINRAPEGFVLQLGSFVTADQIVPSTRDGFFPLERFEPVVVDFDGDGQVDFNTEELSNTRSTVTLALSSGQPNSGTSSFFVNVGDNSALLDPQGFVTFARVADMSTVDFIMNLDDRNLFGDPQSNPTFTDVPLLENDLQVFIERAFVLDPNPVIQMVPPSSTLSETLSDLGSPSSGGSQVVGVPEPPALVLVVGALMVLAVLKAPRFYY